MLLPLLLLEVAAWDGAGVITEGFFKPGAPEPLEVLLPLLELVAVEGVGG